MFDSVYTTADKVSGICFK